MGDLDAYRTALGAALPPFFSPLEVVDRVPTTMARAAELGEAGAPEGATVVAEEQTAGRGRLGRRWVAPPGTGLLVSVLLRPALAPDDLWLVTSLAGVALVDAVDELAASAPQRPRAGLKWPNDLLLDGKKAAGLLAEAGIHGGRLTWVALGMGVNISQSLEDFPPEVAEETTSVALATGARSTAPSCWVPGVPASRPATASSPAARPGRCWPPTGTAWRRSAARSGPTAWPAPRWWARPWTSVPAATSSSSPDPARGSRSPPPTCGTCGR
jgi:hypothetical protein